MLHFNVLPTAVTQAYLQSSSPMRDEYFRNPSEDFDFQQNAVLQLVKPLDRLIESENLSQDPHIKPLKPDPSLYFLQEFTVLEGLNANYIDELLPAETDSFCTKCRATHKNSR